MAIWGKEEVAEAIDQAVERVKAYPLLAGSILREHAEIARTNPRQWRGKLLHTYEFRTIDGQEYMAHVQHDKFGPTAKLYKVINEEE